MDDVEIKEVMNKFLKAVPMTKNKSKGKSSGWNAFVKEVCNRKSNKGKSFYECTKIASKEWRSKK